MKVEYNGIKFDSELEVEYYKYLEKLGEENKIKYFIYHPVKPIQITKNNTYTPDFIVVYCDKVEIIETKGYNQFSFMRDNMIHNVMLSKTQEELREWLKLNKIDWKYEIEYKKIKYLKSFGWVDFDFKNPNTLSNQRKNKIKELETEIKGLKKEIKDYERYFNYSLKKVLTKTQREWYNSYIERKLKNNENNN